MSYAQKLELAKKYYPFEKWLTYDMDMYTEESCGKAQKILDNLLSGLLTLGEAASETEKIRLFEICVNALNDLNDEDGMIETGEREDLCELIDTIGTEAGIDPDKYGDGDGIASEWRDW